MRPNAYLRLNDVFKLRKMDGTLSFELSEMQFVYEALIKMPLIVAMSHDSSGYVNMDLQERQRAELTVEAWKRAAQVREIRKGMGERLYDL
jgi:hypothetical protein